MWTCLLRMMLTWLSSLKYDIQLVDWRKGRWVYLQSQTWDLCIFCTAIFFAFLFLTEGKPKCTYLNNWLINACCVCLCCFVCVAVTLLPGNCQQLLTNCSWSACFLQGFCRLLWNHFDFDVKLAFNIDNIVSQCWGSFFRCKLFRYCKKTTVCKRRAKI